jgi:hypothetical protein
MRRAALLLAGCLVLAGCRHDLRLKALPALQGGGGATLRVVLTYDRNNTLEVQLSGVQLAESYGPQHTRYVVWAQPAGGAAVNVGQVRVEAGKGKLQTLTPFRKFHVFLTVEERGDTQKPGPLVVFHTDKEIEW